MTAWILALSHDALAHIMGFVPDSADWARLLGTGCVLLKQRLLTVKPYRLATSLEPSSTWVLLQMSTYRQLNPNVDTWPRQVEFQMTTKSLAAPFIIVLLPLIAHCQYFSSNADDVVEILPNRNHQYFNEWKHTTIPIGDDKCQTIDIRLQFPRDQSIIKHLQLSNDQRDAICQLLSPSHIIVTSLGVNMSTNLFMPHLTDIYLTR